MDIKSLRRTKQVTANSIDGEKDDIPGHFKDIYSNLYNCVDDADDVIKISQEVEARINNDSLQDVHQVTADEVRKAAARLKPGKGDPSYSFSSDFVKINSGILFEYISMMIKSFLVHAHVPQFLLLAMFVPIINEKLASINVSKNYMRFCITSIILKLLDWVTINLLGDTRGFHKLQFADQHGISSTK